jgi:hypothetical protein
MTEGSGNSVTEHRRWHPALLPPLSVLVYAAGLHLIYAVHISPQFAGEGLTYRGPNLAAYVVVILLLAGVGVLLPTPITRVSHFMLWVLFLIVGAPSALIAQYSTTLDTWPALLLGVVTAAVFALLALALTRDLPDLPMFRSAQTVPHFWTVVVVVSILIYAYLFVAIVIHLSYVSLADPYGMRAEYAKLLTGAPGLGYLVPTQFGVLNPLIMIRGLARRSPVIVAVGTVAQLLLYLTTGERSIFFSILIVPLVYLVFQRRRVRAVTLVWALVTAAAVAWLLDVVGRSPVFTSILVRRFLIVPGALTSAYVAVFSGKPKGQFSDVLPLVPSHYPESAALIVGRAFTHEAGLSANASWLAHGYFSLGYAGVAIETLLVLALLLAADAVTRHVPMAVACALFAVPTIALASSSPFTSILSHGFFVALVVAFVMPDMRVEAIAAPAAFTKLERWLRSARSRAAWPRHHD